MDTQYHNRKPFQFDDRSDEEKKEQAGILKEEKLKMRNKRLLFQAKLIFLGGIGGCILGFSIAVLSR